MKYNLHGAVKPFSGGLMNATYMSKLSEWRKNTPVKGYNDFFQDRWDYSRRYKLYGAISSQEKLSSEPMDYFEFGVSGGQSFRWWLEHNKIQTSRFFGFDTFEGLPEAFGPFGKGTMAVSIEALNITDPRATFYKGLFQDSLIPFLEFYHPQARKLIHLDADLFSATLFVMTQLYKFLKDGDILLFDEFAVPTHEFRAFSIFEESFYIKYDVIGAANNYLFVAIRIKK